MPFRRIYRRLVKSIDWIRGWIAVRLIVPIHTLLHVPIRDVSFFQRRIPFIERHEYSQNGEDGIIEAIFAMIGTTNRYFVEFGVEDGLESNTRYLWKHCGWTGLLMDGCHEDLTRNLHQEFITAENIEDLFRKYNVPEHFDLLSIDIDGNDYWVWKAITHYRPRVVIVEYNAHIPPEESKAIPYNPNFRWDKTDYYGASLGALRSLGEAKGYLLVGTDRCGVNAFFVDAILSQHRFQPCEWPGTFHPPAFKGRKGCCHPADQKKRPWITID
jgi:hypothetical protein